MAVSHDFAARARTTRELFHPVLLHPDFEEIAVARDAGAIDAAVLAFTTATGFDRYAVVLMHDDFSGDGSGVATHWLDNTPEEFRTNGMTRR